jgi:hypothetical protein
MVAMDNNDFLIEHGIDIYEPPRKERPGKWKALALKMTAPYTDDDGKVTYSSVSKTPDGESLTLKQAISLTNALNRLGFKGTTRKNGVGYRVWRIQ